VCAEACAKMAAMLLYPKLWHNDSIKIKKYRRKWLKPLKLVVFNMDRVSFFIPY
jgi:hypothetical protein